MPATLFRFALTLAFATLAWTAEPADATLTLGRKALRNDGVTTAWKMSQKALAESPESAAAHEFAGEVLFRRGDFAQSEAEFTRATKLDPKFAKAWWGLARIAACTSMDKTADLYFRRAHDLAPSDPRLFLSWAMRLHGAEHIDALETYVDMPDPERAPEQLDALQQHIRADKALRGRRTTVLTSPYTKTEIPMIPYATSSRSRSYCLEVEINHRKLRLVLDTGAGGIVIQRSSAEKAGVTRLADASLRGFGDNARLRGGYLGIAERARIGDVEFRDPLIQVADQEFSDIQDGLIGTNVFSQFVVGLDFGAGKLRLDPLPGYDPRTEESLDVSTPPGSRTWTRVYQFGHMLLIPVRVGELREALFVIDTGAVRTLISYDIAAAISKLDRDDKMGLRGINGRVTDVYQAGDLYLQFAGFRQKNMSMTAFDMWPQSRDLGTEVSGFLGLPVISLFTLTIDYRDGVVNFEYRYQ
jgi:tetratricopeptide (TPR) repeat protein